MIKSGRLINTWNMTGLDENKARIWIGWRFAICLPNQRECRKTAKG